MVSRIAIRGRSRSRVVSADACATCIVAGFHSLVATALEPATSVASGAIDLQVNLAENEAFLEGHGVGNQNYICLPTEARFQFMLFTPEASAVRQR